MKKSKTLTLAQLSLLVAIVVLFQLLGSFIHIGPTSVSLVLVPIAVGAVLLGPGAGALLGFVFGLMTLIAGISGTDAFTNILFQAQPFATALICIGKGTLAGLCAGLVYRLAQKLIKGNGAPLAGAILAAATAPIVNTGLFILGGLTLVSGTLQNNFVSGTTLIYFLVIGCAGLNFIAEFALNLLLSPVISSLSRIFAKRKR